MTASSSPLDLIRAAAAATSITEVARRLGYSRPAVSAVLAGRYGANAGRLLARAAEELGRVTCPRDGAARDRAECRDRARRPCPTSSRAALRHWRACRACPHGGSNAQP